MMQSCLGEYSPIWIGLVYKDLQNLFDWVKEWQMELNVQKCKVGPNAYREQ